MDNEAKPSLLEMKQADITVADGLKVGALTAVVTSVAMTVVPLAVNAACEGTKSAWNKFRTNRAAKKSTDAPEA